MRSVASYPGTVSFPNDTVPGYEAGRSGNETEDRELGMRLRIENWE